MLNCSPRHNLRNSLGKQNLRSSEQKDCRFRNQGFRFNLHHIPDNTMRPLRLLERKSSTSKLSNPRNPNHNAWLASRITLTDRSPASQLHSNCETRKNTNHITVIKISLPRRTLSFQSKSCKGRAASMRGAAAGAMPFSSCASSSAIATAMAKRASGISLALKLRPGPVLWALSSDDVAIFYCLRPVYIWGGGLCVDTLARGNDRWPGEHRHLLSASVSEAPNSNLKQRKLGRLRMLRWCQSSLDFWASATKADSSSFFIPISSTRFGSRQQVTDLFGGHQSITTNRVFLHFSLLQSGFGKMLSHILVWFLWSHYRKIMTVVGKMWYLSHWD